MNTPINSNIRSTKMKVFFYLTKYKTINDAVQFYLQIISESLTGKSMFKVSKKLEGAKSADVIVTYFVKDYFVARIMNPRATIINWFQGILPEESFLWQKSRMRYYIYSFMEWFCLKTCNYNFFVSESMLCHYQNKYGYKEDKHFIMPCFNAELKPSFQTKVDKPSFVYIGALSIWQCLDKTLELYKEICKEIPNTSLEILTGKEKEAKEFLKIHGIKNAKVRYVPLAKLPDYLMKFKYGFLIREDININNVATPNKLCTYMASGVTPIYSDVIDSFKIQLEKVRFKIPLERAFDLKKAKERIVVYEKETRINYEEMHRDYAKVFDRYYNKNVYVANIKKSLEREGIV